MATLARFFMAIQLIVRQGVTPNRIFLRKCARWSTIGKDGDGTGQGDLWRDAIEPRFQGDQPLRAGIEQQASVLHKGLAMEIDEVGLSAAT